MNDILDQINELQSELQKDSPSEVKFPLDFYPPKEQYLINELVRSKGLSKQHLGLGLLPIFSRLYSKYRATAFNGAFETIPVFWVSIVDQPGSNKSESLKAFYNQLKRLNNYDNAEHPVSYTSNDTTPEGLIHNMKDQENGIYLFYDEITSFTGGIGQYKRDSQSDKAFWLSMWGGGDVTQFRVNGGIRHMIGQSVSVAGTTQPDTLKKAFSKDLSNGFFDRFLWSVETNPIPEISLDPDYEIDERVRTRITEHIQFPRFDAKINYAPNARAHLIEWYNSIKNCIADNPIKRQFFGKDIIYINRFALLTSLLYNEADTVPISLESAERAIKLYQFCNVMRNRAYNIIIAEDEQVNESMLDKHSIARFLVKTEPDINKKLLSEVLGIGRSTLYNYLE